MPRYYKNLKGMQRRNRRRAGKLITATVNKTLALSTLGAGTLLSAEMIANGVEKVFVISADLLFSLKDATQADGPITVGISHGDFSDAEVEAWYESALGLTLVDKVAQEVQSRGRFIKTVGQLNAGQAGTASSGTETASLNGGIPIRVPIKMVLRALQEIRFWAYNEDAAALQTGSIVNVSGKLYAREA